MRSTPQNTKAPTVTAVGSLKKIQKHIKFSAKSTATEVQLQKLIAFTATRPHHTHELRKFGISHPAGRINDLRKRGYVFDSDRITTVDSDGFTHRGVALCTLVSAPSKGMYAKGTKAVQHG